MARMFIKHQPTECFVDAGSVLQLKHRHHFKTDLSNFEGTGLVFKTNNLDLSDFTYVCFVENGKCWAARNYSVFKLFNKDVVNFECAPFSNNPLGEQMILADMILS